MKNWICGIVALTLATPALSAPQNTSDIVINRSMKYEGPRPFPVSDKVAPCEDLYAYACEKTDHSFKLPDDKSRYTFAFSDSDLHITDSRDRFVLDLLKKDQLPPEQEMIKNYYLACLNEDAEKADASALLEERMKTFAALQTKDELLEYAAENLTKIGFSLLSFGPIGNLKQPRVRDVYLDFEDLMPLKTHKNYGTKELVADYQKLLVRLYTSLGLDNPEGRAEKYLAFQQRLIEAYPRPEVQRALYSKDTYIAKEKFIAAYPLFHLQKLFDRLPENVKVRQLLGKGMGELHAAVEEMSADDLRNIFYGSLASLVEVKDADYKKAGEDLAKKHLGRAPKDPPLAERCMNQVQSTLGKNIDFEVIDRLFANFDKARFEQMVEKIKNQFIENVKSNRWMDEKSREGALRKLNNMRFQTVRPSRTEDWKLIPPLKLDLAKRFENSRVLTQYALDKTFKEFGEPISQSEWLMSPLTINAYYSPSSNQFVMLMGILQSPIYDPEAPDYMNLGSAGVIIGHEIGHDVDDQGAKFDEKGRVRQWMSDADIKKFVENGSRLKKYYEAEGHNGDLTLGENIADLSGLSVAYNAAFPNGAGSIDEKKGFFVQWARTWCGVMRPKTREQMLAQDPHSQTPTRVNVPVKHVDGFYEAFQCKPGDKMYIAPEERVKIW